jgi:MFS family permease
MLTRTRRTGNPLAGLFVVGLGASLAAMDLAVNVALPSITAAFALETRSIRWVVVCYVLTYSSLMLALGKLGDLIGHRRVFRAGLLVSIAAFVLCALAPDYRWLLLARAVQGVATALVLSCTPALATLLFDESKRTRALGAYTSIVALAGVAAPIIGGASIALLGWRGVFWFRVPVALLALALMPLLTGYRQAAQPTSHRAFDLPGSSLLASSLALLLLAPTLAHSDVAAWIAVVTAFAGAAVLIAFALRERHVPEPMLPRAAVRDPDFVLSNIASVAVYFVAFAVPLLVPYYLARIGGYAPAASGMVLALSPAGMLIGSMLAAPLTRVTGSRRVALLGAALVAIGSFAMAQWPQPAALALILFSLIVHGAGIGLFQVAYTDMVVATLPRHDRGVAGSLTMVTRTIGVVTAASALTAALEIIERRQVSAGEPEMTAFLVAFDSVFLYAGGILAALLALSCLRRRLWLSA